MSDLPTDLDIRPLVPGDDGQVLELLQASMGWVPDDQHHAFFRWKHQDNPFGSSPGWVAVDGDRIVGLRVLMRWEFEQDGGVARAVRAVDTATHPDYQGQGLFTRLTRHALTALEADGVDFVFNTPNEKSRPGYLKMGWSVVGKVPAWARVRSAASAARLRGARTPADKWSVPSELGTPAHRAVEDQDGLAQLLAVARRAPGVRTRWSPAFFAWRYGYEPLAYRAVLAGRDIADGVAFYRLRRRGTATEASIGHLIVPPGESAAALARRVVRESGADYAIGLGARPGATFLPVPGQGPILTWRSVTQTTMPTTWALELGDLEGL